MALKVDLSQNKNKIKKKLSNKKSARDSQDCVRQEIEIIRTGSRSGIRERRWKMGNPKM